MSKEYYVIIKALFILLALHFAPAYYNNVLETSLPHEETQKRLTNAYNELLDENQVSPGIFIVGTLAGNGERDRKHKNRKRDTIIYVPNSIDTDRPVDVIFFFHGLGGFSERDFKTRILRHTKLFERNKRNYILAVPEMPWSKNTTTPRSRQGRVFTSPLDFPRFVNSVTDRVQTSFSLSSELKINTAILIGHSAGGSTLKSISRSGGLDWLYSEKGVQSVRIIFSDAGYGRWTQTTWRNFKMRSSPNTEFIFLTRRWDRPYNNTMKFLRSFRTIPNNIVHEIFDRRSFTHTQIGDQALTWSYYINSECGEGEQSYE